MRGRAVSPITSTYFSVSEKARGRHRRPAAFSGVNVLNSTVSGAGNIVFANGSTVTSTGDGSEGNPRGTIDLSKRTTYDTIGTSTGTDVYFHNVQITGQTASNSDYAFSAYASPHIINCTVMYNINTSTFNIFYLRGDKTSIYINDSYIANNGSAVYTLRGYGVQRIYISTEVR